MVVVRLRDHVTATRAYCIATRQAHEAAQLEIKSDPHRQFSHWLLIFPEHVALDNKIFSKHPHKVTPSFNSMTLEAADDPSGERTLRGLAVCWTIAEAGGRQIEADDANHLPKVYLPRRRLFRRSPLLLLSTLLFA
jgi:hypothetical protein